MRFVPSSVGRRKRLPHNVCTDLVFEGVGRFGVRRPLVRSAPSVEMSLDAASTSACATTGKGMYVLQAACHAYIRSPGVAVSSRSPGELDVHPGLGFQGLEPNGVAHPGPGDLAGAERRVGGDR